MNATIEAILDAAARPCPNIRAIKHCRHKVTGETHSPFGMPFNFNPDDYEGVLVGYAFESKDGTTFGMRAPSEQVLRDRWSKAEADKRCSFQIELEHMSESRLASQAEYWLKQPAVA